jgi:XapX domain-containing protein
MKPYIVTLALGLLVGVIYALFNVRSPAPPIIALVGLLGILIGEQIPPLFKHAMKPEKTAQTWMRDQVQPHVFGHLPQCKEAEMRLAATQAGVQSPEAVRHGQKRRT